MSPTPFARTSVLWTDSVRYARIQLIRRPHLAYLVSRSLLLSSLMRGPGTRVCAKAPQVYSDAETTRAVGVIVCKTDTPLYGRKKRGYVAMLSIEPGFRRKGIGEPYHLTPPRPHQRRQRKPKN